MSHKPGHHHTPGKSPPYQQTQKCKDGYIASTRHDHRRKQHYTPSTLHMDYLILTRHNQHGGVVNVKKHQTQIPLRKHTPRISCSSAHSGPLLRDTVLRGNWQKPAARAAGGRGQMKNPSGAVAAEKATKPKRYATLSYIATKAQRGNTSPHPSSIPIHPIPNPNPELPLPKSQRYQAPDTHDPAAESPIPRP